MRTCYLHIGAPKAGSTSIQNGFFASRSWLPEVGLVYPGLENSMNFLVSLHHPDPMSMRINWRRHRSVAAFHHAAAVEREHFEWDLARQRKCDTLVSSERLLPTPRTSISMQYVTICQSFSK